MIVFVLELTKDGKVIKQGNFTYKIIYTYIDKGVI